MTFSVQKLAERKAEMIEMRPSGGCAAGRAGDNQGKRILRVADRPQLGKFEVNRDRGLFEPNASCN
jgi:hypothetical protein